MYINLLILFYLQIFLFSLFSFHFFLYLSPSEKVLLPKGKECGVAIFRSILKINSDLFCNLLAYSYLCTRNFNQFIS